MAISSYLKLCGYQQNELKNVLYLIPKTATKKVHIDGDEAYVEYSGDTLSIIKIKGNNLAFQEDTSFDDRFRFDKTITLTVDGYITFKDFYSKYYAIIEDKSGTFWMANADFPSYITYTYTLNDGENKTDIVFYAASNIPTIKLTNFNSDNAEECETYMPYGIENLKLLEKNKSKLSTYNKTVSTHDDFKYVEAIDGTYELTEEFNGETYSTQLSFSIPLSVYKASWHVKLLEFEKNKYCGYLILKNSDYKAFLGYNTGLFPSYVINGDIVTITLTESSNYGMVFDDDYHIFEPIYRWTRTNDTSCMEVTNTLWRESGTTCAGEHGVDKYVASVLKVSYDSGVTYYNTNVVSGTSLIQANSPDCGYAERWVESGYTCVGYDKYSISIKQESYDSGSTWHDTSYTSSTLVEKNSEDCGYSPYYENRYLTITALEDIENIFFFDPDNMNFKKVYYKRELDSEWHVMGSGSSCVALQNVSSGESIMFKGEATQVSGNWGIGQFYAYSTIPGTTRDIRKKYNVEGNPLSLVYGDNFRGQRTLPNYYLFKALFQEEKVVSAENLKLVATALTNSCYASMFQGCSELIVPPELTAVNLSGGNSCYYGMFSGCTSLTTLPEIHATTLASSCYAHMFAGCTSLTTIPSGYLQATNLSGASYCYRGMFEDCTSLTTIPSNLLPATNLYTSENGESVYYSMFSGCTSLTTIPSGLLPATSLCNLCYDSMFAGCTSLTTVPSNLLPATTLFDGCYNRMFEGCTSLTTVPSYLLPATTLAIYCYGSMFKDCTSLTSSPVLPASQLKIYGAGNYSTGSYYRMFYNCSSLNSIVCYAKNSSGANCSYEWVKGVSATGTFTKVNGAYWNFGNYSGIPDGWTVINIQNNT